jgi:hypothetical protein
VNAAARARLEGWKLSLVDLSSSHPMLDAKDDRSCVGLPGVDPIRLAAAFASGSSFGFETGMDSCFDTGRLRTPLGATELERRLLRMRREARDAAMEGEHVLWLALGLFHWCEPESKNQVGADRVTHAAPLWLVPVELDASLRLVASDGAPTFNHALGEKLRRDFDILFDGGTELPLALAAAEGIAVTRPGWRVERGVRFGVFSFAPLAIWRDLEARSEDELLASPVLAHLAQGGPGAFPQPSATATSLVTRARPQLPELIAPLDADFNQLIAVAASGEGASFVLQGAPGTGKSQTIANLIVNAVTQARPCCSRATRSRRCSRCSSGSRRSASASSASTCRRSHRVRRSRDSSRACSSVRSVPARVRAEMTRGSRSCAARSTVMSRRCIAWGRSAVRCTT